MQSRAGGQRTGRRPLPGDLWRGERWRPTEAEEASPLVGGGGEARAGRGGGEVGARWGRGGGEVEAGVKRPRRPVIGGRQAGRGLAGSQGEAGGVEGMVGVGCGG